jgi:predicted PurR-regulated permease PerM
MNSSRPALFWLAVALIAAILIYLLNAVLLPFVAGALVAYLLAPIVARLERNGLPRWAGAALALLFFIIALVVLAMLVIPALATQVKALVDHIPALLDALQARFLQWLPTIENQVRGNLDSIKSNAGGVAGEVATFLIGFAGRLLAGGAAVVNALSLLFIMPVVAFYLLRDWPRLIATVDGWLPRPVAPTVRELIAEMDRIIAAFIRGVGMVCLALAAYYAIALTLVGLQFGLAIGLFAGLAAFVPVFGALIAFVLAFLLAVAQLAGWKLIALVIVVFGIGQVLEGYVFTPRFVGDRVGLHPVWILFALMAGGALFGFVGILLAVPTGAAIGVLARFALSRYRQSAYFDGRSQP